jgi:hypothetical protein
MRGLLVAVDVEPRPRGKQPIEIEAPELVLADWRAGLSCRAIAEKHGLASHDYVSRFLRGRGIDPTARPARQKVPGIVLGRAVTDWQAMLRRRPPMKIPLRTPQQRRCHAWLLTELEAISYELAAGRFTVAPRGRSGLPERVPAAVWNAGHYVFWLAMQKVQRAA